MAGSRWDCLLYLYFHTKVKTCYIVHEVSSVSIIGIFNSKKLKRYNTSVFPYSMDDMMKMDVDPLLKQPTMLVLHRGGLDCGKIVDRILGSVKSDLPQESMSYIVQAITGTFASNHLYRNFYTGSDDAKKAIRILYDETNRRLDLARDYMEGRVFHGPPIYFLFDGFSEIQKKNYGSIFGQLIHIMVCARQTNIHTIVFDKPFSFCSTDSGAFSSLAVLSGGYENKYSGIVPKEFRDIPQGYFYFSPHSGDDGISSIDLGPG